MRRARRSVLGMTLLRHSLLGLVTRIGIVILAAALGVTLARGLGPGELGTFTVLLLIVTVASVLALLGLSSGTAQVGVEEPGSLPALAGNGLGAALTLGLLGAAGVEVLSFLPPVVGYFGRVGLDPRVVRWLALALPVMLANTFFLEIQRAAGRVFGYNLISLLRAFTYLAAAVLLVVVFHGGVLGAVIAWLLAQLVTAAFGFWWAWWAVDRRFRFDLPRLKQSLAYGLRVYPGNVAEFLNYRLDVFLVAFFLSPREVGQYAVAVMVAEILWEVPNALRTFLVYRLVAIGDTEAAAAATARVSRLLFAAMGVACVGVALAAEPLLGLVFGGAYRSAALALAALMPGVWALSLGKLLASHLATGGRGQTETLAAILSLAATVALDLALIPRLGILGAGVAATVSYLLATLVIAIVFLQTTGQRLQDLLLPRRDDLRALVHGVRMALGYAP